MLKCRDWFKLTGCDSSYYESNCSGSSRFNVNCEYITYIIYVIISQSRFKTKFYKNLCNMDCFSCTDECDRLTAKCKWDCTYLQYGQICHKTCDLEGRNRCKKKTRIFNNLGKQKYFNKTTKQLTTENTFYKILPSIFNEETSFGNDDGL